MKTVIGLLSLTSLLAFAEPNAPDLVADFEGSNYGTWKSEGTAFGSAPARGPLGGQMKIEGFAGSGLVNSFLGGDSAKGRLSSPPFKIQRKFFTFLIGGGGFPEETCLNLVVGGKVVRTATGPNTEPGGSEILRPLAWDVSELVGKEAILEIVDQRDGGWGHINVDNIQQVDDRGSVPIFVAPKTLRPLSRLVTVSGNFLQLPLIHRNERNGNRAGLEKLVIEEDGKLVRYMHVEIATAAEKSDLWYSVDMREFKGRSMTLKYKSSETNTLDQLAFDDKEIIDPHAYESTHRPLFHFSPRLGWMNDINGSYYKDGLYHIFYQFNPAATTTGAGFDMHWGHSVSKDLTHWEEWPVAIFPNAEGQCYSGTAVMQQQPIPGINEGVKLPAPVLFFAATTPFSQHLATSPDDGKSWKRFAGNPVVPNKGQGDRDPKVIWHEASQHYIMVLYVGGPDTYRILRSKDLKTWEETSSLPGWFECPEFIPVKSAVTGEDLLMLYGCFRSAPGAAEPFKSDSCYQLGKFDGKTFTPVTKHHHAHLGPNYYAALLFMNAPNGRLTMMGWARGTRFPNEKFSQCASVPLDLKLKAIDKLDTLCFEPAEEIKSLRGPAIIGLRNFTPTEAATSLSSLNKEVACDIELRFRPGATGQIKVKIRSLEMTYDMAAQTINGTKIHLNETVSARILIDHGIVESFWNGGEAAFSHGSLHTDAGPALSLEGEGLVEELQVYPMRDIWKK